MRAAALLGPSVSERALQKFREYGAEVAQIKKLTDLSQFEAALVFGGDGTIHRFLQPLIEGKIALLPVPVGSGNDFAHALGINSVEDAISVWRQFCCGAKNLKAIDVGVIRSAKTSESGQLETGNSKLETYFCNIAGVGLDCEANRRANAMPRWLRAQGGYILAALSAIAVSSPTVVTVSTETSTISEAAMLVAIANTTSYGGGMRIAPRAQLADGLLDICFVRRTSGMRLLWNFPRVFRGEHLALPEVEYLQARQLRIASERPMDLYADGEFVCRTPVEIEVVPQALRVISPLT